MNLRRISYPGFGKFMLDSKEALKRIIEICLVKPPEDFSSLCGILVSICGPWQAQQLYRRSCNPSIMARCSKGSGGTEHHWHFVLWNSQLLFCLRNVPLSSFLPIWATAASVSYPVKQPDGSQDSVVEAGVTLKQLKAKPSQPGRALGTICHYCVKCTEGNAFIGYRRWTQIMLMGNQLSAERDWVPWGTWNYGIQSNDWVCFGQGRARALHIPLPLLSLCNSYSCGPAVTFPVPHYLNRVFSARVQ